MRQIKPEQAGNDGRCGKAGDGIMTASTERGIFMDRGRILKGLSTETGVFVDEGTISSRPSMKMRGFVDGRQIYSEKVLSYKRK